MAPPGPGHQPDLAPDQESGNRRRRADDLDGPQSGGGAPPGLGASGTLGDELGAQPPSQAQELVERYGADAGMAEQLEANDPLALAHVAAALGRAGCSNAAWADALLGMYLGASPPGLTAALGAGPWFGVFADHALDLFLTDPVLVLLLHQAELGGPGAQAQTAGVVAQLYGALGLDESLALRHVAVEGLTSDGKVSSPVLAEMDTLLLTGTAGQMVQRAAELTQVVQSESEAFSLDVTDVVTSFAAPPTMAQMQAFLALLQGFEPRLVAWKGELLAFEKPSLRWVLRAAHQEQGEPDFEGTLREFRETFQAAIREFSAASDAYNSTEIERERELAQERERSGGLRHRGRTGEEPLDDQDWVPMHIPGLAVRRHPVPNGTVSRGTARGPDEITSAVVHTGTKTADSTIGVLGGKKLEGHYAIDPDGSTQQMHPASQSGAHAGVGNSSSVAIDLASGQDYGDSSAMYSFLQNSKQLIATAKVLQAHERVSPQIGAGGPHHRGEVFGSQLGDIDTLHGAYGGQATYGTRSDEAAGTLQGVYAHQELPDTNHSDPGSLYMMRLHTMRALLQAYEQQYGPIQLDDDKEVERVIGVFEAYKEATGNSAGPIDEAALNKRVQAKLARLPARDRKSPAKQEKIIRAVFTEMVEELAREHYGEGWADALAAVKAEIAADLDAGDVVYKDSVPEKKYLKGKIGRGCPSKKKDRPGYDRWQRDAAAYRSGSEYEAKERKFKARALASLATRVLVGRAYVTELQASVAEFRTYLQEHLPDLLQ